MLEPLTQRLQPELSSERGVTLVELLVVIAVLSVLLTLSAPSLSGYLTGKRVEGVTNELVADLQWARTESVSRNALVRIRFNSSTAYQIETETPLPASISCTAALAVGIIKTTNLPAGLTLKGAGMSALPTCMAIEPVRATAPLAGSVEIDGGSGYVVRVTTGNAGRVQTCVPAGSKMGAYQPC